MIRFLVGTLPVGTPRATRTVASFLISTMTQETASAAPRTGPFSGSHSPVQNPAQPDPGIAGALEMDQSVKRCLQGNAAEGRASGGGYAVAASRRPSSLDICSRMMNFCALPVTVIGKASTNFT